MIARREISKEMNTVPHPITLTASFGSLFPRNAFMPLMNAPMNGMTTIRNSACSIHMYERPFELFRRHRAYRFKLSALSASTV